MADPQEPLKGLAIPTRGSDVGTWDLPVNNDFTAIGGMLGGIVTKTVSNTNITLTSPAGFVPTPGAGPTEAQNAIIRMTGNVTGSFSIVLPLPGFYIIDNKATYAGAFNIILTCQIGGGLGEQVCAPIGQAVHVFSDGSNVRYINLPAVGSYLDIASSIVPVWITGCTVPPYLNCDGSTFSAVTYPILSGLLGGTTLPDLRGRMRATLNQGTGRITTAANGNNPDGNTLLATGGIQSFVVNQANLAAFSLTVTENPHHHTTSASGGSLVAGSGLRISTSPPSLDLLISGNTGDASTGITVASGGTSASISGIPPVQMAGITLIRAG